MAAKVLVPVTATMSTRVTRITAPPVTVTTGTRAIVIAGAVVRHIAAAAVVALIPIVAGTKRGASFRLLLTFLQLHSGVDD
jgi:hypothetical protein